MTYAKRVTVDTALDKAINLLADAERLRLEVADLGQRVTTITDALKTHHDNIADLVQLITDEYDDQP